ncbi:MAG: error-prone DNA polymerase [Gammaproteobacteria bacterium]|jgi:error-prone DNA polymerase
MAVKYGSIEKIKVGLSKASLVEERLMYAELHCLTNFSFLRGASHPKELVQRALELGYSALAITDECSVAGVARAYLAAKDTSLNLIVGSEFSLNCGLKIVILATDRQSYGQLSTLITQARMAASKGHYILSRGDLAAWLPKGCLVIWIPTEASQATEGVWLQTVFPQRLWLGVELFSQATDQTWLEHCQLMAGDIPLVSCGNVHMHSPERQAIQDTVTAIRLGVPLSNCGMALFPNAEHHLRPISRLRQIYPAALLAETTKIAALCDFSLGELGYEYPQELVPEGHTPSSYLAFLTWEGAEKRWPAGIPENVRTTINRELDLVKELKYEPFFLTVHDVVKFARSQNILCQGRGSAANSAVCYALWITEVDPNQMTLLFERFISKERAEPPDIDVDFEHERREEVIQYIYNKYGRHRAALAATVITYRARSAIRDVGKALGLALDQVDLLAKSLKWWDKPEHLAPQIREIGLDPDTPVMRQLCHLVIELLRFPRHLSQHVGGFVIAKDDLRQLVPVENASMANRSVIQWDKDDLATLGLLKVDVLALGMLTAIRKSFNLIAAFSQKPLLTIADLQGDDPAVYAMIQKADTIGTFQIESRAQMAMLPRLKPKEFYDLVIQVAIVRPGPIQGDMVHPYLRRRNGEEDIDYPKQEVKAILERTLGVPIFQEQVMKLVEVTGGFTPGEADNVRRNMAAWKSTGDLAQFESKLRLGMQHNGYTREYADRILGQIKGFAEYGFPESHSASFALLAYVSCWLKHYYPAAFTAALINSQPMGFYRPSQLVQDAQRHGVKVLPIDVRYSDHDCTLEHGKNGAELRLGLRLAKGFGRNSGEKLVAARQHSKFDDAQDISQRAQLNRFEMEALASANALRFQGNRYQAYWQVAGIEPTLPLLQQPRFNEATPLLKPPTEVEELSSDYANTGLSIDRHPMHFLRPQLESQRVTTAEQLRRLPGGKVVRVAGLVIGRQRPGTATGVIFVTLEDETGLVNVIVWPKTAEAQRKALLTSQILMVTGTVQTDNNVTHLIAGKLTKIEASSLAGSIKSRDFH